MRKLLVHLALVLFALAPALARAGGDEVVVIYNKNMPGSQDVADHYALMRQVPPGQVYGFALTTNEIMSRAQFQDSLQIPLANKLEKSGLWKFAKITSPATKFLPKRTERRVVASKIRYAVLCYGVPLTIYADPDLHEDPPMKMAPELQRNDASVDSELAWLPLIDTHPSLVGPMPNWTYGVTNADMLDPTNGILLVARLDGPSALLARGLVDKAIQAERDGLWGRGYFDARGLDKTNALYLGDEWILGAAQIWHQLGFETFVDNRPDTISADFPMSQIAVYCGWYASDACGPFALPKVEFMPGAFAYHLHSFSATTIRNDTHGWVGPFVAKGVTCTMGCVNEPYLPLTPNVAVFLYRFTANGFTFGQAAWAAQPALSWQTTVVGDPLYRPFGTPPRVMLNDLETRQSPLVEWPILRAVDLDLFRGRLPGQMVEELQNIPDTTNSAVLTEKLAQLYAADGNTNAATDAFEKALQLDPSPEQRIRLRLTLGKYLELQNFKAAARLDYQKLLEESPDYPGNAIIEAQIASLPSPDTQTKK